MQTTVWVLRTCRAGTALVTLRGGPRLVSIALLGIVLMAYTAGSPVAWARADGHGGAGQQVTPVATFQGNLAACQTDGSCENSGDGGLVLARTVVLQPGLVVVRAQASDGFGVSLRAVQPGVDPARGYDLQIDFGIGTMAGAYSGSGAVAVPADSGMFALRLYGRGTFTLTLEQPTPDTANAVVQNTFTGVSDQVSPYIFLAAGQYTLTATSTHAAADERFAIPPGVTIQLLDLSGDPIAADSGASGPNYLITTSERDVAPNDAVTFTIGSDGPYLLAVIVAAHTQWALTVSGPASP